MIESGMALEERKSKDGKGPSGPQREEKLSNSMCPCLPMGKKHLCVCLSVCVCVRRLLSGS